MSISRKFSEFRRTFAPQPVHGVWREVLAEFAGTLMLIYFGCGSVAQSVLSKKEGTDTLGTNLGFALGTMMGMFLARETSGGHLNPAITLPMVVMRRLPLWKFPFYAAAQFLGAFFGAVGVYMVYNDAIIAPLKANVRGDMKTAAIFATYPNEHLGTFNGFIEQMCATCALVMLFLAITDRKNMGIPKDFKHSAPPAYMISKRFLEVLSISLLLLVIGVSLNHNSGYAINPARDLGPRLFTLCAGWGTEVFTAGNYWFWVPVLGPMTGGLLGAAMYHLFIGLHLSEPRQSDRDVSVVEDISDDQAQQGEAAAASNPGGAQIP